MSPRGRYRSPPCSSTAAPPKLTRPMLRMLPFSASAVTACSVTPVPLPLRKMAALFPPPPSARAVTSATSVRVMPAVASRAVLLSPAAVVPHCQVAQAGVTRQYQRGLCRGPITAAADRAGDDCGLLPGPLQVDVGFHRNGLAVHSRRHPH